MGLWFIFNVAVFLGLAAASLYAVLGKGNLPKDPSAYLRPEILFSVFLIAAALGLLKRSIWARAAAVAVCIWIMLFPVMMVLGLPVPLKIPVPAAWPVNPIYLATFAALIFSIKSLRMYYSAAMDDAYMASSPAPWRVGLLFFVAGAAIAAGFRPEAPRAKVDFTFFKATGFKAVERADRTAPPQAPAAATMPGTDARGIKACKISLDETRLLLVSSDGQGHAVDLRTGKFVSYPSKIDTREWPSSFTREAADPVGADADMYYDSDRNIITRFSDPNFRYGIGGSSNQFISFTSSPGQIVVYNRDTLLLRRIEIPIGTVIWSLKLPADAKTLNARVFTAPDYAWLGLALAKNHVAVVGMRDGRMIELHAPHSLTKSLQFGARWVRVAGTDGEGEKNSVYMLPGAQAKDDLKFEGDEVAVFDLERDVYVTKAGQVVMSNGGLSFSAPVLRASVLNPPRYAVAMEDGKAQMEMIDLDAQTKSALGKIHGTEFSRERACFTVSSTRRVFAAAVGSEVEIFWSAYLAPGQFRSVVLTLPVAN